MFHSALPRHFCAALLAVFALSLPSISRAQSGYTIIDLGAVGQYDSYGSGINAIGQVTGYFDLTGEAVYRVVRWTKTTAVRLVTLGGANGFGNAINASGQIAGQSDTTGNAAQHAVRWTGTTAQDLGTLGGGNSYGAAINAGGQVAGWSSTPDEAEIHAVRWTGTEADELDTLGGTESYAYGINDSGQAAGYSLMEDNLTPHAVRWTETTAEDLGTLGGSNSYGNAINESGQVAGAAQTAGNGAYHAVRWTETDAKDLGTLGGGNSTAYGINNSGTVVGTSTTADGEQAAFLCIGETMVDCNALLPTASGWQLSAARAINGSGWITGTGYINGQYHAYILKPVGGTLTGRIALEGVYRIKQANANAPLGTFHFALRTPGTTEEIYHADISLTLTDESAFGTYTLFDVPGGLADFTVKGSKSLRVLLPDINPDETADLPDTTLPAGDANNDNQVDIADFAVLLNAYGTTPSDGTGSYNPACDFNYDGRVNVGDFGLLVNEYGNVGAL